ncbi:MAG: Fic family protein [Dermatophilaceae bacterium]
MSDPASALATIAALPEVTAATDRAREACTRLRWHQALRRRIPEAAAESRIRGAWASAELDGARSSLDAVRDLMRGARLRSDPPDPAERVLHGAMAATAATETLGPLLRRAPRQAVARLHLAAAADLLPEEDLGRPRAHGQDCPEFAILGAAPSPADAAQRLDTLDSLLRDPDNPAFVVAAIAHAEVAHARPFVRGNGLVARALERTIVQASGLDPTGVVVPEAGHLREGSTSYQGALAAYGTGTRAGLLVWLDHCADSVVAGADAGREIADAVLAGRLS